MKYGSSFGMILVFLLCLFLVDESCGQKDVLQHAKNAEVCPAGTRCMERSRCRSSVLKTLSIPPKDCGLTYVGRQRICCPERKNSPTFRSAQVRHVPMIGKRFITDCGESKVFKNYILTVGPRQGSWPWMAEITIQRGDGGYSRLCSAVMITRKHLLSAAHCFQRRDPSIYIARIGHVDSKQAHEYGISQIDVPDTYRRKAFYDDIAVLTLSKDVSSEDGSPICLPESTEYVNLTGRIATVVGWALRPDTSNPDLLLEIPAIPVISNQKCNALYGSQLLSFRRDFRRGITNGFYCAGTKGKNTCSVTSGAPLMYMKRDRWHVVGLAAFGVGSCDTNSLPDGYTRVAKYLNWILQKIKS